MAAHVVGDDDGAGHDQRPAGAQVVDVATLVSVDEDEVEAGAERCQRRERRSLDDDHPLGEAGPRQVLARQLDLRHVALQRDERPVGGGQRPGDPDRRVAVRGADLQDAARAEQAGQPGEQRARLRTDVPHPARPQPLGIQLVEQPVDGVVLHLCRSRSRRPVVIACHNSIVGDEGRGMRDE